MPAFKVESVSVCLPLKGVLWSAFISAEKSLEENSIYMTVFFLIFCITTAKKCTEVTQADTISSSGNAGYFKKSSVISETG